MELHIKESAFGLKAVVAAGSRLTSDLLGWEASRPLEAETKASTPELEGFAGAAPAEAGRAMVPFSPHSQYICTYVMLDICLCHDDAIYWEGNSWACARASQLGFELNAPLASRRGLDRRPTAPAMPKAPLLITCLVKIKRVWLTNFACSEPTCRVGSGPVLRSTLRLSLSRRSVVLLQRGSLQSQALRRIDLKVVLDLHMQPEKRSGHISLRTSPRKNQKQFSCRHHISADCQDY